MTRIHKIREFASHFIEMLHFSYSNRFQGPEILTQTRRTVKAQSFQTDEAEQFQIQLQVKHGA